MSVVSKIPFFIGKAMSHIDLSSSGNGINVYELQIQGISLAASDADAGESGSDKVGISALDYVNIGLDATGGATLQEVIDAIDTALASVGGGTVKVSADDSTPGYLEGKITSANSMLTVTVANDGADEDLVLTVVNSAIDHGTLAGLSDDDHSQYHNDTRGDIRYYTKSQLNSTSGTAGAELIGIEDTATLFTGTTVETALAEVGQDAADLRTLSGTSDGATHLGTFTGTTIADSSTIKGALQALETSLEALPDPMEYKGNWAASTNTPTLADGIGNNGDVYYVTDAGTVDFGAGNIIFAAGDRVVYSGTDGEWQKWDTTDAVNSVNGLTGAVTLTTTNIAEGSNLYFTDERAQDAVATALTAGPSDTITFSYNDGSNAITAQASGVVKSFTVATGGVTAGDIVRYTSGSEITPARANSAANSKGVIGIALETASAAASCKILIAGSATVTASAEAAIAAGDIVYLSKATAGRVTSTNAGTEAVTTNDAIVELGTALSSTTMLLKIGTQVVLA